MASSGCGVAHSLPGVNPMRVGDLAINGRIDQPLGVDDRLPTLSWRLHGTQRGLRQTAYQLRAAMDESKLHAGDCLWDSGKVSSDQSRDIRYGGPALDSRQRVVWQVRVWDGDDRASAWSAPSCWEMGLLEPDEWAPARWIEHPDRAETDPLPLFARQFLVAGEVATARLYIAGIGLHEATLNGQAVTDEVLAPGNSNYQRSVEYRTYDVTDLLVLGRNSVGVRLGNGTAFVHRNATNSGTGRTSVYAWWVSRRPGCTTLRAPAPDQATAVEVHDVDGFAVGATVNIGNEPESRWIVSLTDSTIVLDSPLVRAHDQEAPVTGSGSPVADLEPSAGTAVTPRLIAKLEITRVDGSTAEVSTGTDWVTALGPFVTDQWYSGTDYDSRREQAGWDQPNADLAESATRRDGSATGWVPTRIAPPPNLATELVWRAGEPVRVVAEWEPLSVRNPVPGTWVFDLGENLAGWPELCLDAVPTGTTLVLRPAESLLPDGTVDQRSIHNPQRGSDVFHTYTAWGCQQGERWRPSFQYFGMRFLQITGLPEGYRPTRKTVRCARLRADVRPSGLLETSDARVNRIHRMVYRSVEGNMLSVLTDCPGREKLSYGADYTHPMSVLTRNFDFTAYLRTMQRHLVEAQSKRGNVALKAPVYDWGYADEFGDEINWGNAIILVPWLLYENYGDTSTMANCYPQMCEFLRYITTTKAGVGADAHIVTGPLGDWVASEETSGDITGTWGYYLSCRYLAKMAALVGYQEDAAVYYGLAHNISSAFHTRFFSAELGCYSGDGTEAGATQAAQALALDAGLVPEADRERVLDALVQRIYAYQPYGGGPHLSVGHIGLGPLVRTLTTADRDDVLWDVLREDAQPSYGHFVRSTAENPGGLTTIPEQWDLQNSLNHMILTQIDEWFHTGLAGIRQVPGSVGYRNLIIKPKVVGDLDRVAGCYDAPEGRISTSWSRSSGSFVLEVGIPPNTVAEIWVPGEASHVPEGVGPGWLNSDFTIYRAGSGQYTFQSSIN